MSQASTLFRLQQIDSQMDTLRARLAELEELLKDQAALQAAQEKARQAEAQLEEDQKKLRHAETQVQDHRFKIEQDESTLYSGKIRNPKELQDLQHEVASLRNYLAILEDRQLELMMVVEESEKALLAARQELLTVQARTVEQNAQLLSEKSNHLRSLERLEIERQAASAALTAEELQLYTQLRQSRRGVAVARIVDRTCSACGAMLTPALIQSASSPTVMARCATCGRILFPG